MPNYTNHSIANFNLYMDNKKKVVKKVSFKPLDDLGIGMITHSSVT